VCCSVTCCDSASEYFCGCTGPCASFAVCVAVCCLGYVAVSLCIAVSVSVAVLPIMKVLANTPTPVQDRAQVLQCMLRSVLQCLVQSVSRCAWSRLLQCELQCVTIHIRITFS